MGGPRSLPGRPSPLGSLKIFWGGEAVCPSGSLLQKGMWVDIALCAPAGLRGDPQCPPGGWPAGLHTTTVLTAFVPLFFWLNIPDPSFYSKANSCHFPSY